MQHAQGERVVSVELSGCQNVAGATRRHGERAVPADAAHLAGVVFPAGEETT